MEINTGLAYRRMAEKHGQTQRQVAGICAVSAQTANRWFMRKNQSIALASDNCKKLGWDFLEFMEYATGRKS